jgi:hypothetical protein
LTLNNPIAGYEDLKNQIGKFAKLCDWTSAVEVIKDFVKTKGADDKRIFELLADSYYGRAFAQNSREDFKTEILRAKENYEKVVDDLRCIARGFYCKYWACDDPDERREIIVSKCLPPARLLLEQSGASNKLTDANAFLEFLDYLFEACITCKDRNQLEELVKESKRVGKDVFQRYKNSRNPEDIILITNSYLQFLEWASGNFLSEEEAEEIERNVIPIANDLIRFSETLDEARLKSLAYEALGKAACLPPSPQLFKAVSAFEKAVEYSNATKDSLLIGRQLAYVSFSIGWAVRDVDMPERRKKFHENELRCGAAAVAKLRIPIEAYYIDFIACAGGQMLALIEMSKDARTNLEKEELLEKAIEAGRAVESYSSYSSANFLGMRFADALSSKARLVRDRKTREELLYEAIKAGMNFAEQFQELTGLHWNVGIAYRYTGIIKADLADEKENLQEKEILLRESSSDLQKALAICLDDPISKGREVDIAKRFYEAQGNILLRLFELTHQREHCITSIVAFTQAVEAYSARNLFGFSAPLAWKIATLYDAISEYEYSSRSFVRAAETYEAAAKNQKSLEKIFADLSLYMQAWAKIEEARSLHSVEKYLAASELFRDAAAMLEKSERYRFLAPLYQASALTELAEDQSRKEKSAEAAISFGNSFQMLVQAEKNIRAVQQQKVGDDTSELEVWIKLSKERESYNNARKALEEAKTLDREGEAELSLRKYRLAADNFKQIGEAANENDRRELEALTLSCEAWATMKQAEYRSSPELYAKASELFLKAKDNSAVTKSFVLSCLANASMCEALAAGTTFKRSSDVQLYSEIKTKLGAASRYYEEAGFEIASDWTRATEALFDAFVYLASAEGEVDPQKKTQMYHLAEKHLELSARRYGDIGYEKKKTEVLKHLKTARENRELLITPMEALSQGPAASSTPVNFTRDQAVGLERFEVANLTGNVSLSTKQTNVGSSVRIDVDLANVGKTPALLMKLDNIAPSGSFEVEPEKNQHHFLEGGTFVAVDLKGKRLEYLKSHEMSLHFVAKRKGSFEIKPRLHFVDEYGKYRSYEFEPQTVEVRELGFMGWAKGK